MSKPLVRYEKAHLTSTVPVVATVGVDEEDHLIKGPLVHPCPPHLELGPGLQVGYSTVRGGVPNPVG